MKDPHASRFDGSGGFIGGAYIGAPMSRAMVAVAAADGAPVAGFLDDVGGWFEDAVRDIGQAFEDAASWLAENLDLVKTIANIGIGLMHAAAAVCAVTGIGLGAAAAIELAAVAVDKGVDWALEQIESAAALAEAGKETVDSALKIAGQYRDGVDKIAQAVQGDSSAKANRAALPPFLELRNAAGRGNAAADRAFSLATLGAVLFTVQRAIPFSAGLSPMALIKFPGVPGAVKVLVMYAELLKSCGPEQSDTMTRNVGRWLAWKDETINDAALVMMARTLGIQDALGAPADFSALIPGSPTYKQFDPSPEWIASVHSMTTSARTAEARRLVVNYPEAECLPAFAALAAAAPNPRAVTPEAIYADPMAVNALYKSLPTLAAGTTTAFAYNPQAGGFAYDAAMKGAMAAGLSPADRARWLATLIVDNIYAAAPAGTTIPQRVGYLAQAARSMGANFGPPVVSGPFQPIDAARVAAAASKITTDRGADLKSLATTLRSWAAGYEQRAAEWAAELERRRLADAADYKARLEALQALQAADAKESAAAASSDQPRRRIGLLVDRSGDAARIVRGTFERTGSGPSVMVSNDGIADPGNWEQVTA